jgi:hypothetical protein
LRNLPVKKNQQEIEWGFNSYLNQKKLQFFGAFFLI